jgi:hypothetical protein
MLQFGGLINWIRSLLDTTAKLENSIYLRLFIVFRLIQHYKWLYIHLFITFTTTRFGRYCGHQWLVLQLYTKIIISSRTISCTTIIFKIKVRSRCTQLNVWPNFESVYQRWTNNRYCSMVYLRAHIRWRTTQIWTETSKELSQLST